MSNLFPQSSSLFTGLASGTDLNGFAATGAGGGTFGIPYSGGPFNTGLVGDGAGNLYNGSAVNFPGYVLNDAYPCYGFDQRVQIDFTVKSNITQTLNALLLCSPVSNTYVRCRFNNASASPTLSIMGVVNGSSTTLYTGGALSLLTVGSKYSFIANIFNGNISLYIYNYQGSLVVSAVNAYAWGSNTTLSDAHVVNGPPGFALGGQNTATTGLVIFGYTATFSPRASVICAGSAALTAALNNGVTYTPSAGDPPLAAPTIAWGPNYGLYHFQGLSAQAGSLFDSCGSIVECELPTWNTPGSLSTPFGLGVETSTNLSAGNQSVIHVPSQNQFVAVFFSANTSAGSWTMYVATRPDSNGSTWTITNIQAQFAGLSSWVLPGSGNALAADAAGNLYFGVIASSNDTFTGTATNYLFKCAAGAYTTGWTQAGQIGTTDAGNEIKIGVNPSNGYVYACQRPHAGAVAPTFYVSTNGGISFSAVTVAIGAPACGQITPGFKFRSDGVLFYTGPNNNNFREVYTLWFNNDGTAANWNPNPNTVPASNYPAGTIFDYDPYTGSGNTGGIDYSAIDDPGDGAGGMTVAGMRAWPNATTAQIFTAVLYYIPGGWSGENPYIPPNPTNVGQNVIEISASGTTQATATPLPLYLTPVAVVIGTVPAGSGVVLQQSNSPYGIIVINNGSNTLNIYPPSNGTINGGSVNSPITLTAGSKISLWGTYSGSSPIIDWYSY